MKDEMDLRLCFDTLLRHKWSILGVTALCGLVTFVVLTLLSPKYEATALVAITRPLYQFQFTPNIQNILDRGTIEQFTGKAGVELATSDFLMQESLKVLQKEIKLEEQSLYDFRKKINVSIGRDPSILKFTAKNDDPETVAKIANVVANLYVRFVNELYGQSASQKVFFEQQLATAGSDLKKAEKSLIDFERRNTESILKAQLDANKNALNAYLALSNSLNLLRQNVLGLKKQLARHPSGSPSNMADELTALLLQINAFHSQQINPQTNPPDSLQQVDPQMPAPASQVNVIMTHPPSLPVQLQIPAKGTLSNKTVAEQVAYLNELALTIEATMAEVKRQSDTIPNVILALQGQLQQVKTEGAELNRLQSVAKSTYNSLAQKAGETRITAEESSGRVRIASNAIIPERPIGGRLLKTVIAMFLGFLLSTLAALSFRYLQTPPK